MWDDSSVITDKDLENAVKLSPLNFIQLPRYVVIWSEDLDADGREAWILAQRKFGDDIGCYEDWDEIPSGAYIWDFQVSKKRSKTKFERYDGCYQTFFPHYYISTNSGGKITLCKPVHGRLGQKPNMVKNWKKIIREIFETKGQCVLSAGDPALKELFVQ